MPREEDHRRVPHSSRPIQFSRKIRWLARRFHEDETSSPCLSLPCLSSADPSSRNISPKDIRKKSSGSCPTALTKSKPISLVFPRSVYHPRNLTRGKISENHPQENNSSCRTAFTKPRQTFSCLTSPCLSSGTFLEENSPDISHDNSGSCPAAVTKTYNFPLSPRPAYRLERLSRNLP